MKDQKCKSCKNTAEKTNQYFCNRSCAATYNNSKRIRVVFTQRVCACCKLNFKARLLSEKIHCSEKCRHQLIQNKLINDWKLGLLNPSKSSKMNFIRTYLREKQNSGCFDCKLSEWEGHKIPLQLEHKNGIHSDNSYDNLCLLCPNCHALKSTSGSRNKGRGRSSRPSNEKKVNQSVGLAILSIKKN